MPRRMIQRAFLIWLEQNRSRFAIEIELGRRTDTDLEFTFAGINGALIGVLTTWEISVYVIHQGENWDCILDVNAEPKRVLGGYVCDVCPPESRPVFQSRPALWADHLFKPFLDWVNESLAKAKWLGLYGRRGYATWAKLLPDDPPSRTLPDGCHLLNSATGAEDRSPSVKLEDPPIFLPCRLADYGGRRTEDE